MVATIADQGRRTLIYRTCEVLHTAADCAMLALTEAEPLRGNKCALFYF